MPVKAPYVSGNAPASRTSSWFEEVRRPSDRVILWAFFASFFVLHYVDRLLRLRGDAITDLKTAEVLGFVAVGFVLIRLGGHSVLRAWDLAILGMAALTIVHPWPPAGGVALTFLGAIFALRRDRSLASLGQLCLGLAWIELWGFKVLAFVAHWLLPLETAISYWALSLFGQFSLLGNSIGGESGHRIIVFNGCSVFQNTILISFMWLALVKIQGLRFHAWQYAVLAISLVALMMLNTARLALMAYSYEGYEYWHNQAGATFMAMAPEVILMSLYSVVFLRRSGPKD